MKKEKYTNASDIGRMAFCPRSVSLEKQGKKVTADAKRRRSAGDNAHDNFNKKFGTPKRGPCFIATEVFGESHPITESFRDYRDTHLNSVFGRAFIAVYYATSPYFCRLLRRSSFAKGVVRKGLIFLHHKLCLRL